jgi:hypothetical protein
MFDFDPTIKLDAEQVGYASHAGGLPGIGKESRASAAGLQLDLYGQFRSMFASFVAMAAQASGRPLLVSEWELRRPAAFRLCIRMRRARMTS